MSKPTVTYKGEAYSFFGRALLHPVNHPNHLPGHEVSNTNEVTTSLVLSWDKPTGRIETKNTIYMPEVAGDSK